MTAKKAVDLFSFIAKQIQVFLEAHHGVLFTASKKPEVQHIFSLGFTFSYPAYQRGINSGILLRWTKGFDIPDAVGQDVCQLLQHAIDELHLPVKVTALINDAAGTIMSRAYTLPVSDTRTSVGAIFGTGTNGVYLEKLSKITKELDGAYDKSTGEMFISCEWGSFDNALLVQPNTSYDAILNKVSVNPGNQMFEKRVSGMFLGELLRIALLGMHTDPEVGLFKDFKPNNASEANGGVPFLTRWAVDTSILSIAEMDNSDDLVILRQKVEETLCIPAACIRVEDARAVKMIAHAIGRRAARLAGMAVGSVILKSGQLCDPVDPFTAGAETLSSIKRLSMGAPSSTLPLDGGLSSPLYEHSIVDVGVDGSVVEFYPGFETYMREALRAIDGIGPSGEKRIRIGIAKDGSSVGAAIIALFAAQEVPIGIPVA